VNEAMADEFLRFLVGYIKEKKVKTDAIHRNLPKFGSIFKFSRETGGVSLKF